MIARISCGPVVSMSPISLFKCFTQWSTSLQMQGRGPFIWSRNFFNVAHVYCKFLRQLPLVTPGGRDASASINSSSTFSMVSSALEIYHLRCCSAMVNFSTSATGPSPNSFSSPLSSSPSPSSASPPASKFSPPSPSTSSCPSSSSSSASPASSSSSSYPSSSSSSLQTVSALLSGFLFLDALEEVATR